MLEPEIKILIAEDTAPMREMLLDILRGVGAENVTTAKDGKEALMHFQKSIETGELFDMVITDINMPNMSGIELLKAIKQLDAGKKIPIIMITTESEKDIVLDCIMAGASDYIIKPYDPSQAAEKILATFFKSQVSN